jgi:Zn-dependent protease
MFEKKYKLFTAFGFPVRLSPTWFIIVALIAWSLAAGLFPHYYENLSQSTYWIMGIVGAVGLFACVLAHELGHSIVANKFGLRMRGITLFLFGGVSEMPDEAPTPKAEVAMALAGPMVSIVLGVLLYFGAMSITTVAVRGVLLWMAGINILLAAFNLLPGLPLDGGRILRAGLWAWKKDLLWATRIASRAGGVVGLLLIGLGLLNLIAGNWVGAIWWGLLGLFLRGAAKMAYRQLLFREMLEDTSVDYFADHETETVPAETSVQQFVDDYVYRSEHRFFIARRNAQRLGCVDVEDIKHTPRESWGEHNVGEYVHDCSELNSIHSDAPAVAAWKRMQQNQNNRLLVTEDDQAVGEIRLEDIYHYLRRRMEMEGQTTAPPAKGLSTEPLTKHNG